MVEPCFKKKDSDPSVSGVHDVPKATSSGVSHITSPSIGSGSRSFMASSVPRRPYQVNQPVLGRSRSRFAK